jgi:hypothetical protein
MKKFLFSTLLLLFCTIAVFGQQATVDEARTNAQKVTEKYSAHIDGNSYLLFSIADTQYLVVVKHENRYEEYYLTSDSLGVNIHKRRILRGNRKILTKAFDKKTYHKEYIDLNSPFYSKGYETSSGNTTYFYLKDTNGIRYGETSLTTIISPTPMDKEIYYFLQGRLLWYINK